MSLPFSIRGTLAFADAAARDAARAALEATEPLPGGMAQAGATSLSFAVDVVAPASLFQRAVGALFDAADGAVGGSVTCACGDETVRVGPPSRRRAEAGAASTADHVSLVAHAGDVVATWLGRGTLQWAHLARPDRPVRCRLAGEQVYGIGVAGSLVCWWGVGGVGLFDVSRDSVCWRLALDDLKHMSLSTRGVLVLALGGGAQLRDARTGALIVERPTIKPTAAARAVRDGRLAVAATAVEVGVYALETLERVGGAVVDLSSIASLALSAEGRWAVASDVWGKVARLETASGVVRLTRAPRPCSNVSLSDDGRFIALSSRDALCVYDAEADAWAELRGGPDGHGLEPNNNEVIAVTGDEVIARDPFRARAWRLERPNDPTDFALPKGQRNCGAFRRSDGAVFLLDTAGRLVPWR